jgi:hypothetical protein
MVHLFGTGEADGCDQIGFFASESTEWRPPLNGTHLVEFADVEPLGNAIRIEMAAFYTFDSTSGKLIGKKICCDQAGVLEQMRGGQTAAAT